MGLQMVRIDAHDLHLKIPSMIEHWAELYTVTARPCSCSVCQHVVYAQRFVPYLTGATRTRTRSTRTRTRTRTVLALTLAFALSLCARKAESPLTLCISEERLSGRRHRP